VFALVLIGLALPQFNTLTGKHIVLPIQEPYFYLFLLALILLTGFIAGSYPALFLSSLNPVKILKGTFTFGSGSVYFRKGLVVFQFVLSIVLIIGTIVVSKQVSYTQTKNLGYDRENLIYIPLEGDLAKQYDVFKEQALDLPGIQSISRMSQTPTNIENGTLGVHWDGKDESTKPMFTNAAVGYDFIKTMKISILQGRDFSKDYVTDSVGFILNEQTVSHLWG